MAANNLPSPLEIQQDLRDFEAFVNNATGTVNFRTGGTVPTIQQQVTDALDGLGEITVLDQTLQIAKVKNWSPNIGDTVPDGKNVIGPDGCKYTNTSGGDLPMPATFPATGFTSAENAECSVFEDKVILVPTDMTLDEAADFLNKMSVYNGSRVVVELEATAANTVYSLTKTIGGNPDLIYASIICNAFPHGPIQETPWDIFPVTGNTAGARATDLQAHIAKTRTMFAAVVEVNTGTTAGPFEMRGQSMDTIKNVAFVNVGISNAGWNAASSGPVTGSGSNATLEWVAFLGFAGVQMTFPYGGTVTTTLTSRILLSGGADACVQGQYPGSTLYLEGLVASSAGNFNLRGKQTVNIYIGGSHHGAAIQGAGIAAAAMGGTSVLNATGATFQYNAAGPVFSDNSYGSLKDATSRHNDGPQVRVEDNSLVNATDALVYKGTGTTVLNDFHVVRGGTINLTDHFIANESGIEPTYSLTSSNVLGQDFQGSKLIEDVPRFVSGVTGVGDGATGVDVSFTVSDQRRIYKTKIYRGPNVVLANAVEIGEVLTPAAGVYTFNDPNPGAGNWSYFVETVSALGTLSTFIPRSASPVTI